MPKIKKKLAEKTFNKKAKSDHKSFNPFEVHINKQKHEILGQKLKNDRGLPGVSRARAIQKRKHTLLPEYNIKDKSNKFLDRRIGEKNYGMSEEARTMARFTAERMKHHNRKSIYNLADDEVLTHRGQTLSEIEKFDDPRSDDDDDVDEEGRKPTGKLDDKFVGDAHFGGGVLTKTGKEGAKSHKDLIDQLIAESKKRKAEKQKTKEETSELTEKLDNEWKDLLPLVNKSKKTNDDQPEVRQKPDDYDKVMRELKFEARGNPSDRLKSEDEIAREEKERLEKLEQDRQNRMMGITEKPSDKLKHRSADDLDDNFNYDSDPEETLAYDDEGKMINVGYGEDKEKEDEKDDIEDQEDNSEDEEEESSETDDDLSDLKESDSESDDEINENIKTNIVIKDNKNKKGAEIETMIKETGKTDKTRKILETHSDKSISKQKISSDSESESDDEIEENNKNNIDTNRVVNNNKIKEDASKENKRKLSKTHSDKSERKRKVSETPLDKSERILKISETPSTTSERILKISETPSNKFERILKISETPTDKSEKILKITETMSDKSERILKISETVSDTPQRKRKISQNSSENSSTKLPKSENNATTSENILENELDELGEIQDERLDLIAQTEIIEKARAELPYTYTLPDSYETLQTLLTKQPPEYQDVIIERMIKCNHPSLAPENKENLSRLFVYLLQHLNDVSPELNDLNVENIQLCFSILNSLTPHLFTLTQLNPINAKESLIEVLKEKQNDYRKKQKQYPGVDVLVFLKIVSCLFSTSDFRHQVVTPAFVFISQLLTNCKIKTRYDIVYGLFLVTLFIEVHQACLQRWVDEKQKGGSVGKVLCPQCQTEYIIVFPDMGTLVLILDTIDNIVYKSCPFLAAGIVVGAVYWTAVTYGAITVMQVVGHKEGLAVMEQADPLILLIGLPAIPVALIVGKMVRWEDTVLTFIRRHLTNIPLIKYIMPFRLDVSPHTPTTAENDLPPFTDPVSATRVLCGALLLPTLANIFGRIFFDSVKSNFHKTVLGGITFIAVKGALRIYHKQQKYIRQCQRKILDYSEANISTYLQHNISGNIGPGPTRQNE